MGAGTPGDERAEEDLRECVEWEELIVAVCAGSGVGVVG